MAQKKRSTKNRRDAGQRKASRTRKSAAGGRSSQSGRNAAGTGRLARSKRNAAAGGRSALSGRNTAGSGRPPLSGRNTAGSGRSARAGRNAAGSRIWRRGLRGRARKGGSRAWALRCLILLAAVVLVSGIIALVFHLGIFGGSSGTQYANVDASEPEIDVQLLDINAYSRPGIQIDEVNAIVIHYTANPGTTAQENRDYFNGLQYSQTTKTSSNFVIGLEGEIIQCVPTWEMAYASNDRNSDTVSIECCHPEEDGKFTDETYASLVQLTAWLCTKFGLDEGDVIRHYDITGKNCPKYFVENEEAWEAFLENVADALGK